MRALKRGTGSRVGQGAWARGRVLAGAMVVLLAGASAVASAQVERPLRLRIASEQPDLRLFSPSGLRAGRPLCASPCETSVPRPGRYRFVVGTSDGHRALGLADLALWSDSELFILYESRDALRIGGGIAAGLLVAAGLATVFTGAFVGSADGGGPGATALLVGGAIGTTVGVGLAIGFGALGDSLRVVALPWPSASTMRD